MTTELIIPEPLRAKARELALPDSLAADLLAAYAPFAIAGSDIKSKIAAAPAVTPSFAREMRLAMVKVRTGADKKRRELKADSLLRGKATDGLCAMIELEATGVERAMEDIEKAAERAEAARVAKLREDRLAALRPYVSDPSLYAVEKMTDAAFAELVESSRLASEARAAAAAEAERVAAAKVEADRKAAEEAAAARLEAAKKEAADNAKREAEEAAADALAAAAKRESDAKEAAARADREAKRQADLAQAAADAAEHHRKEQAKRIEQMEADAKARRQREEAEAREAEAREETRRKKMEDDRAAVVARIAADLAALKKAGKISSMTALAECIVSGGLRGVTVDWEVA